MPSSSPEAGSRRDTSFCLSIEVCVSIMPTLQSWYALCRYLVIVPTKSCRSLMSWNGYGESALQTLVSQAHMKRSISFANCVRLSLRSLANFHLTCPKPKKLTTLTTSEYANPPVISSHNSDRLTSSCIAFLRANLACTLALGRKGSPRCLEEWKTESCGSLLVLMSSNYLPRLLTRLGTHWSFCLLCINHFSTAWSTTVCKPSPDVHF